MTIRTSPDRAAVLAALDAATMGGMTEHRALLDMLRVPGTARLFWTETGRRAGLAVALRSWRKLAWRERDRERRMMG